jgi:hypothetical protein
MSNDIKVDEDLVQLRLRRLENRYRSAQSAVTEARALHGSLQETPEATDLQRSQALRRFQSATQHLLEIQQAIERIEDQDSDVHRHC